MSFILTVEHVSGGKPAHCCRDTVQTKRSVNLTVEYEPGGHENTRRYRLCDPCADRLLEDLARALRRPLMTKDSQWLDEAGCPYYGEVEIVGAIAAGRDGDGNRISLRPRSVRTLPEKDNA